MKKKVKITLGILGFTALMVIAIVGAVIIAKSNIMKDMPVPASEGQAIVTLEYISEKKSEDDAQSTATIIFYDDHTCSVSGLIANMYKWEYITEWSAEDNLQINDDEMVTANCVEELEGLAMLLKLELTYDLEMQYASSVQGEELHISFTGVNTESGETLMDCYFTLSSEELSKLGVSLDN